MLVWETVLWLILLVIIPPIVIGEALYSLSRKVPYRGLPNFSQDKIITRDGVKLHLWTSPSRSKKLLIVVHGHRDHARALYNRIEPIAKELQLDSMYLDLRNHGRSDIKRPLTVGIREYQDILGVVAHAQDQNRWDEIYLYGTSLGAMSILLAGDDLVQLNQKPGVPRVSKVILDSSFLRYKKAIRRNLIAFLFPIPWLPFIMRYIFSYRFQDEIPNLKNIYKKFPLPILLMRGNWDFITSKEFLDKVEAIGNPKIRTKAIPRTFHSRVFRNPMFKEEIRKFLISENVK